MDKFKGLLVYKILRELYYWVFATFFQPFIDLYNRIRDLILDHRYEKILGINTLGSSACVEDSTMFKDSHMYDYSCYGLILKMVDKLKLDPDDVFVDLGCGLGRVVCFVAAKKKLKKVIGIEARQDIFNMALDNVKSLKIKNTPVEIINADAAAYDMNEGTVFFMSNPFGVNTQKKVLENIRASLKADPRQVRIVCCRGPDLEELGCVEWLSRKENSGEINIWYA
jgi:precorrin-6B methylase 2